MAEEQTTNPEASEQETPVVETTTNEAQTNPEQFLKDFNWHNYEEGIDPVADEKLDEFEKLVADNFVETLEPPTIATIGLAGLANAFSSASSSAASSGPAQATGANLATPCVDAWARCAVPKASITNTSHSAA